MRRQCEVTNEVSPAGHKLHHAEEPLQKDVQKSVLKVFLGHKTEASVGNENSNGANAPQL